MHIPARPTKLARAANFEFCTVVPGIDGSLVTCRRQGSALSIIYRLVDPFAKRVGVLINILKGISYIHDQRTRPFETYQPLTHCVHNHIVYEVVLLGLPALVNHVAVII